MLNDLARAFVTWFAIGFVSSAAGIAAAQGQPGPGAACPTGTKCCQNPLPVCFLVICASSADAGECNCCFCVGSGTNKCLLTDSNATPPYGCDQACLANP